MNKGTTKMIPGDELHLTMLMAPYSLNLVTGQDRQHLLAFGRAAFDAGKNTGQATPCLHQIAEPVTAGAAVRAFRDYLGVHDGIKLGGQAMDDMALDLARIALDFKHLVEPQHPDYAAVDAQTLRARIAELESQLEAIGAGGVEPLRKTAAAPQAVQAVVPATNHSETPNSSTIIVPYGWKLVPDGATPDWVANLEALPDWREAVGECIKRFLAAAPAHPAEGVPATDGLLFQCGKAAGRQEVLDEQTGPDFWEWVRRAYRNPESTSFTVHNMAVAYRAGLAATQPAAQGMDARTSIGTLWVKENDENTLQLCQSAAPKLAPGEYALFAPAKQGGDHG